ncbi:MAG: phosphatase PAP2 family protein [Gammaproteobacteria bacterium]|nr:phosphatase PAP2 family protein [Gammaproteobacteria bacterium]
MATDRRFWLTHAIWPLLLFVLLAALSATTPLDKDIARAWAWDAASGQFMGTGAGEWWAKTLIHGIGGSVMRSLGALLLLLWAGTFVAGFLHSWRRPLGFLIVCIALGTGTVALLKQTTNIDCPRSLAEFGGSQPYLSLFAKRPAAQARARCFPGGHSSSGFALFAVYFLCRARSRRLARASLALALSVGGLFAFGQEARGAHFLSHDVWSAAILWFGCLATYTVAYRCEVWATGDHPCKVVAVPGPTI